jgi:hypothetical protein
MNITEKDTGTCPKILKTENKKKKRKLKGKIKIT